MPRLDARLKAVAEQVVGGVHADVGSDHGHLLKALLASGRISEAIAIENKHQPYDQSLSTLSGYAADVRFADGLDGLRPSEADSVSFCGMGGELIEQLLRRHPDRVPPRLIVQPNRCPEAVRTWALNSAFHLVAETYIVDRVPSLVMTFEHATRRPDPAYEGLDREAAILFGPLLIRKLEPAYESYLRDQYQFLSQLTKRTERSEKRMRVIQRTLAIT